MHLKSLIFSEKKTIYQAIERIQKDKIKILIVTDNNNCLIGTLTDGDIRRGILKGYSLNTLIKKVTNRNPKKIADNEKYNFTKINNYIKIIPVVDKKNKLIDIKLLRDDKLKSTIQNNLEVVLMAGGFGKRLLPLTKKIPKPMIKINKKPLLEQIINNLKKYGVSEFKISTHYKSSIIRNYFKFGKRMGVNIKYIEEKEPLGTIGCIGLLNYEKMKQHLLIYNGDIFSNINLAHLFKFHVERNSDITIGAKEYFSESPFGRIVYSGHKVKNVLEKPQKLNFINAGIYIFKKKLYKNFSKKNKDIVKFIKSKIKLGHKCNIYPIYEYWTDIGSLDSLKKIQKEKKYDKF